MINPAVTAGDLALELFGDWKIKGNDLELILARTKKINNRKG